MNICEDRHEPKYQVTYKSAQPKYYAPFESVTSRSFAPVWLVCDLCMENKQYFGSEDEIEKVELLA